MGMEYDQNLIAALEHASQTVVPDYQDPSGQTYIDASYYYAKLIDPDYKNWRERGQNYKVNPTTEKLLIDFYEKINNKSPEEIISLFHSIQIL